MTYEEAVNLVSYKNYCTCGGFACGLNGRDPRHPHMEWCPQLAEFEEREAALERGSEAGKGRGGV